MTTCRELTTRLGDYLAGELAPDEHRRCEAHLGRCVSCLEYLRGYRTTIRLVRGTADPADPRGQARMPEDLVQAILASRRAYA